MDTLHIPLRACSSGRNGTGLPPGPGGAGRTPPSTSSARRLGTGKRDLLSGLVQLRKAACARRYQPTAASRRGQPGAPRRSGERGPQRGPPRPPLPAVSRRAPPPAVPSEPSRSSIKKDETRAEVEPAFSVASSGIVGESCVRGVPAPPAAGSSAPRCPAAASCLCLAPWMLSWYKRFFFRSNHFRSRFAIISCKLGGEGEGEERKGAGKEKKKKQQADNPSEAPDSA